MYASSRLLAVIDLNPMIITYTRYGMAESAETGADERLVQRLIRSLPCK
jgi:hypothetical protein